MKSANVQNKIFEKKYLNVPLQKQTRGYFITGYTSEAGGGTLNCDK